MTCTPLNLEPTPILVSYTSTYTTPTEPLPIIPSASVHASPLGLNTFGAPAAHSRSNLSFQGRLNLTRVPLPSGSGLPCFRTPESFIILNVASSIIMSTVVAPSVSTSYSPLSLLPSNSLAHSKMPCSSIVLVAIFYLL